MYPNTTPPLAAGVESTNEPPHVGGGPLTTRQFMSDQALTAAAKRWAPTEVDMSTPNPTRIKHFLVGGANAWAIEKAWCDDATRIMPSLPRVYRTERAFLHRAVRFAVQKWSIHRFLAIGAGLPYVGHVHEYGYAGVGSAGRRAG
jgi:hypothetical protein